jgi:hypothetical protein
MGQLEDPGHAPPDCTLRGLSRSIPLICEQLEYLDPAWARADVHALPTNPPRMSNNASQSDTTFANVNASWSTALGKRRAATVAAGIR